MSIQSQLLETVIFNCAGIYCTHTDAPWFVKLWAQLHVWAERCWSMFLSGGAVGIIARKFFVVQKCPTHCKMFNVPGPCWLNASRFSSHCKNQLGKNLPPGSMPFPGGWCPLTWIPLSPAAWECKGKACAPKPCLSCLAFHWISGSFTLPVLQSKEHQAALEIAMGIITCSGCWMYLKDKFHMKQAFLPWFFTSRLTISFQDYTVGQNLCQSFKGCRRG